MTAVLDGAGEGSAKALSIEKTGQVLVRTRPQPDARKTQRFQSGKLAMSGDLNLQCQFRVRDFQTSLCPSRSKL